MKPDTMLVAVGDAVIAAADVLASTSRLERTLRVLGGILKGGNSATSARTPNRAHARPEPTIAFTEIDKAKADRALANLGVRKVG